MSRGYINERGEFVRNESNNYNNSVQEPSRSSYSGRGFFGSIANFFKKIFWFIVGYFFGFIIWGLILGAVAAIFGINASIVTPIVVILAILSGIRYAGNKA